MNKSNEDKYQAAYEKIIQDIKDGKPVDYKDLKFAKSWAKMLKAVDNMEPKRKIV
jgi:hypothetical protein